MSHQDLATAVTSQSMMGSRISGPPGAIGSGMPLTGSQSSHIGSVGSTVGTVPDSGGTGSSHFNQQQANGQHKRGIQTSPDGKFRANFNCRDLIYMFILHRQRGTLYSYKPILINFRKGNEHSTVHGNGPIWNDRSLNFYKSCRD